MKEYEIRPKDIFDVYLELSAKDVNVLFKDTDNFHDRPCPGCGSDKYTLAFDKLGFSYLNCNECGSLYASPVPTENDLSSLYTSSKSAKYWANVFFPSVAEVRRKKIFRPRAIQALNKIKSQSDNLKIVIDVGAGSGLFLDELTSLSTSIEVKAIEPGVSLARDCRAKGYETFEGFAADAAKDPNWQGIADLVTSFEVIEHLLNPKGFLQDIRKLTKPGGMVLLTGLCGDGFDIRTLGERSKSVSPPHHLNFLSRYGVDELLKQAGLELVEFLTPGRLDLDIVINALAEDDESVNDPFLRMLCLSVTPEVQDSFQKFLSDNGLSSHMWVYARRPSA